MTLSRLLLMLLLTAGAWAVTAAVAVPDAAASCVHQGRRVNCPPGVADGSRSLRFNNGGIVWSDGTTTPRSACCSPATANGPATGGPSTPPTTPTTGTPPGTTPTTGGPPPGGTASPPTPTAPPGPTVSTPFSDVRTQVALADQGCLPRFVYTSAVRSHIIINSCVSNLLFPFVTNVEGFETGLSFSYTARDPFGVRRPPEGIGLGPSRVEAARDAHRRAFRAVTAAVGDRLQYFDAPLGALTLDPELGTTPGGFLGVRNDVIAYIYFQLRGGSLLTPETIAQLQPVLQPLLQEEARTWQELGEAKVSADPVRGYPMLNALGFLLRELTGEAGAPGPGGGSAVDQADADQAPAVFPPPGDDTPVDQVM